MRLTEAKLKKLIKEQVEATIYDGFAKDAVRHFKDALKTKMQPVSMTDEPMTEDPDATLTSLDASKAKPIIMDLDKKHRQEILSQVKTALKATALTGLITTVASSAWMGLTGQALTPEVEQFIQNYIQIYLPKIGAVDIAALGVGGFIAAIVGATFAASVVANKDKRPR